MIKNKNKILVQFLRFLLVILALSFLSFMLMRLSPIDPVQEYLRGDLTVSQVQIDALKEKWGLGENLFVQYYKWLSSVLKLDFGVSRLYNRKVIDIISIAFLNSSVLMLFSWVFSAILGYLLGVIAAHKRGKLTDKIISIYAYITASIPPNVMALVFLIVFALVLKLFPIGLSSPVGMLSKNVSFFDRIRHFVLPFLTLTVLSISQVALHTRRKMIDVLNSDFVLYAKSKGQSSFEIFKNHGFKNSLIPVITLQLANLSELFGGAALLEIVFSYKGLGSVMTEAGLKADLPLFLGASLISSVFVFTGNFLADIISKKLDPRME